jgi:hypothetical protein
MKRKYMEVVNYWLPQLGIGIFWAIAISAWFAEKKIVGLWFGFAGLVSIFLLAALQIQDRLLKEEVAPLSPEAAAQRIVSAAQSAIQRAWLSISPQIVGEIREGKPITLNLVTENVGREPATGVSHHGVTMMFDMPAQISYAPEIWSPDFAQVIKLECDLAHPMKGKTTIFPNNKPIIEARWDNAQDVSDLVERKKLLVTYGCLGYFTKDEPHYTWYCFFLMREQQGQWRLGSAPIGNDAN